MEPGAKPAAIKAISVNQNCIAASGKHQI